MDIKKSLARFYDKEAEKYYHTRNKHRADADIFLDELQNCGKKTINILEFGCGSGRLLTHLTKLKGINIKYVGVDLSKELLKFAKKQVNGKNIPKYISTEFVHDDIVHYIQTLKQESFDFVVGIASFQHLPTIKERFFLIKNIYRILKYNGKFMMSNRSFSLRFLKKFKIDLFRSLRRFVRSFGKHQRNDLMLPRKNNKTIAWRFYHIFTLSELQKLLSLSGFTLQHIGYVAKGKKITGWKTSQNSLLIASKSVFLKNETD